MNRVVAAKLLLMGSASVTAEGTLASIIGRLGSAARRFSFAFLANQCLFMCFISTVCIIWPSH